MAMSNPLVADGLAFYATGNPYFNGANTAKVARGERAVRGPGLNGIYALDARTGEERWRFLTAGQNMPTPVLVDGSLVFSNGDGHAYALDARTGALKWKQDVVSINGMSSLAAGKGLVFFGGSRPGKFYALEARTGRVAWTWSDRALSATGMGDATPAYAEGVVVESTVLATGRAEAPVVGAVLALEAKSGRELWRRTFDPGQLKPGMSTGTPVVHGDRIYVSSPIDGRLRALSLRTGAPIWQRELAGLGPAGVAVADGRLYVPHGDGRVSALNKADGQVLTSFRVGGRFGPTSPVIWGRTIYLTNMYGWVSADPLPAAPIRR
jgi:outer membrane protein assembly factor BamB